jgi:acyl-CoA thioester hydrolase
MAATQDAGVSITVHLPVRLDEIDYLGIVHSSNYLKYMEHARIKLLEQQSVDLLAWVKKGIRAVVVNDTINYQHPARYGDVLAITCRVEEIGEHATRLGYSIMEQKTEREILQAATTMACIDPNGRPASIPVEVREALSRPV